MSDATRSPGRDWAPGGAKGDKCNVEDAFVLLNSLFLRGWILREQTSLGEVLVGNEEREASLGDSQIYDRRDLQSREPAAVAFFARYDLDATTLADLCADAEAETTIVFQERAWTFRLLAASASDWSARIDKNRQFISALLRPDSPERDIFASARNGEFPPDDRGIGLLVDQKVQSGMACAVLTGWSSDSLRRTFCGVTEYALSYQPVTVKLAYHRADVEAHLTERGSPHAGKVHGFVCILENPTRSGSVYLGSFDGGDLKEGRRIEFDAAHGLDRVAVLSALSSTVEKILAIAPQQLVNFLSNILLPAADKRPVAHDVQVFAATERPPKFSIVVPFYRQLHFMTSVLDMQTLFGDEVEWIIVNDYPPDNRDILNTISSRRRSLSGNTIVVSPHENLGFGGACNLGASVASSDFVCFFNSDIYMRSAEPLRRGVDLLAADESVGLVGFTLCFEDGSIQHRGMRFRSSEEYGELLLAEHPGKGLPLGALAVEPTTQEAVTGALILVRKADFADEPYFSDSYVLGDFEDADLCMRVRAAGKTIKQIDSADVFHLERQSISNVGMMGFKRAVTLVNAITFTTRWREEISGSSAAQ